MKSMELPEYQIFSVLRAGTEDPIGPYSQNEIVELLNEEQISTKDLVYYEGIGEWKPLGDVFNVEQGISNFEDDGQDRETFVEVFMEMSQRVPDDELIYYVATQEKPTIRLKGPTAVAVTAERICISTQRLTGKREYETWRWSEVDKTGISLETDEANGEFILILNTMDRIDVPKIPRKQLKRLDEICKDLRSPGEPTPEPYWPRPKASDEVSA